MQYAIESSPALRVRIELPSSKSLSNRALCITALIPSSSQPHNLSECDDTDAVRRALLSLSGTKDVGAAGTAMRFLTAYFAASPDADVLLTGTARMLQRPIGALVDALNSLGANIKYVGTEGFPPLKIIGKALRGGEVSPPGNISSQYISALLMVAPTMRKGLRLNLRGNILSRPYIDMTLGVMRRYGAKAEWIGDHSLEVAPVPYKPTSMTIENDWSAASYWYEMVALSPDPDAHVELCGLEKDSLQGDSRVAQLFEPLGVKTIFNPNGINLTKANRSAGMFEADLKGQPDLAQTIVTTCALLAIPFRISGLSNLRIKETDRIEALRRELSKLSVDVREEQPGVLSSQGHMPAAFPSKTICIDTYNDHRMAMAFAPCCNVTGVITIKDPSVVTKSYPGYWSDLEKAGFKITTT